MFPSHGFYIFFFLYWYELIVMKIKHMAERQSKTNKIVSVPGIIYEVKLEEGQHHSLTIESTH